MPGFEHTCYDHHAFCSSGRIRVAASTLRTRRAGEARSLSIQRPLNSNPTDNRQFQAMILPMHVVIFEGAHWRSFAPFSLSRPVFMLPCGAGTLLDKQIRATRPSRVTLWVRPELEEYCRKHVLPTLPCPGDV